jgi:hypothetical protein
MDMRNVKHFRVPRLPKEYQEVEYLRSMADGYIDSGYAFTEPELKIEFKYMKEETLSTNPFGVDTSSTVAGRLMHGHIFSSNIYSGNGGRPINFTEGKQAIGKICEGSFELIGTEPDVQKCVLRINGGSQTLINNATYFYGGCGLTDYVLGTRANAAGSTSSYLLKGRLYYIRFFDNTGTMVRNFVPCYRKSDGVVGLYDRCGSICQQSGTPFYVNIEDGAFEKGPDVVGGFVRQITRDGVVIWEESE